MKTTVEEIAKKFYAWPSGPMDDRLSKEVVADLIREALAAKESGELAEPEPVKDLVPPRPWGIEDDGSTLWIGPLRKSGKIEEIVVFIRHKGYTEKAIQAAKEKARYIVSAVNAYKPTVKESLTTETIETETRYRFVALEATASEHGAALEKIEKRLAKLEAKADAPATPQLFTPEMWAIIEKFSKEHAVASKIAPLMRELKKQGAYDTEIATPDPDGWQPLTETNHPPWSHGICYELKGGSTRAWYFYDDQALRCAIADGATHWRVPKTDEAKGQP